jgi:hypothetical protein
LCGNPSTYSRRSQPDATDGQAQGGGRATMSSERHAGASSLRRRIETVFDARALGRAMFALVPLLLLALVSGRSEWLTAAIVPVAMLIACDSPRSRQDRVGSRSRL